MTTDDRRPQWFTVSTGLLCGAWTRRWVELRREAGKVICREWPNHVQAFAPEELMTEEQASKALEKARMKQ